VVRRCRVKLGACMATPRVMCRSLARWDVRVSRTSERPIKRRPSLNTAFRHVLEMLASSDKVCAAFFGRRLLLVSSLSCGVSVFSRPFAGMIKTIVHDSSFSRLPQRSVLSVLCPYVRGKGYDRHSLCQTSEIPSYWCVIEVFKAFDPVENGRFGHSYKVRGFSETVSREECRES